MKSILNSIKQTLGLTEENSSDKKETHSSSARTGPVEYDVTFTSQSLGITIVDEKGKAIIERVTPGSTAQNNGVRSGDIIVAVEGNVVHSFEGLSAVIGGLEYRPLIIRFRRELPSVQSNSYTSALDNLTDEEKEQRRVAMIQAAKIRSKQLNGLSVPVTKKKTESSTPSASAETNGDEVTNEETEKLVRRVKKEEERMVQELGYNPFRAHMSSVSEAKTQIANVKHGEISAPAPVSVSVGSMSATSGSGTARIVDGVLLPRGHTGSSSVQPAPVGSRVAPLFDDARAMSGEDEAEAQELVDEAISLVVSTGDSVQSETALRTVSKLLTSLVDNMDNAKYRSIRVSNPRFNERVMAVPGGSDLMNASGFVLTDTTTTSPTSSGCTEKKGSDGNGEGEGEVELFFVHNCHIDATARLRLTVAQRRVNETLQILFRVESDVVQSSTSAAAAASTTSSQTTSLDRAGAMEDKPGQKVSLETESETAESKRERMLKAFEQRNKAASGGGKGSSKRGGGR